MTKYSDFSNSDDVIDSRDVIAKIDDLQSQLEDLQSDLQECEDEIENASAESDRPDNLIPDLNLKIDDLKNQISDITLELIPLQSLADKASGSPDWEYGETLIRDTYFKDYAQELAEDVGDMPREDIRWPYTCIDWEQAASELQMDYMNVTFDGIDYWIRA